MGLLLVVVEPGECDQSARIISLYRRVLIEIRGVEKGDFTLMWNEGADKARGRAFET
jgi:hypothetical protein